MFACLLLFFWGGEGVGCLLGRFGVGGVRVTSLIFFYVLYSFSVKYENWWKTTPSGTKTYWRWGWQQSCRAAWSIAHLHCHLCHHYHVDRFVCMLAVKTYHQLLNPENIFLFVVLKLAHTHDSSHCKHCFPAPFSKLCQNWLCHWRGIIHLCTAVQYPRTHVNGRCIHPGLKKEVLSQFRRFWFYLCWRKQRGQLYL